MDKTLTAAMGLNLFRLDGKTAFVSGAPGHLGSAMARVLVEAGAHVILNGRNAERLEAFAKELGGSNECAAFDVGDIQAVRKFFAARKRIDILVNNAISMTPKPMAYLTPEDFTTTFESSVVSTFEAVRAAHGALRRAVEEGGDASVINVSSMYGVVSPDSRIYSNPTQSSPFHYGPAKAALLQLTRHLAAELGPEQIRVNAIVPGPFPRLEVAMKDGQFAKRLGEKTMLRRTGKPEEIAGPLLFLSSPASSYVTGSTLTVDGGWTAW
jgi:NAD(P)-dependent dehydrogenase (short-subunit alcohol dehydrogenase family)